MEREHQTDGGTFYFALLDALCVFLNAWFWVLPRLKIATESLSAGDK
jgi:hypothetical protein